MFAASLGGYVALRAAVAHRPIDLAVYSATGDAVSDHTSIYGQLGTPYNLHSTYPPFAALLFTPLGDVSLSDLAQASLVVNVALIILVAALTCVIMDVPRDRRRAATAALAALSLWAEPVLTTLRLGQINLLILALVLGDFARPRNARWRGAGVGLAAAIKVVPAIFIAYWLLTRRFHECGVAVYTFVLSVAVGSIVLPNPTRRYWTSLVFEPGRVGRVINEQNQSLQGLAARLLHVHQPGTLIVAGIAVFGVAGLLVAALAARSLGERWGMCACAVTGLLVTPIAWTHHWVWCIPIAMLLWSQARAWVIAVAIFWAYAPFLLPIAHRPEWRYGWWESVASGWYVYFGLAFLGLTAYRSLRTICAQRVSHLVPA